MFSNNYEIVVRWLENQIRAGKAGTIFLNSKSAERAFKTLDQNLAVLDSDRTELDHFLSVHLNKSGMVKLKTTIRIYKKRELEKLDNSKALQCTLYASEARKLDKLAELSGFTKQDIVNMLIISADYSDFSAYTEEQLELL